MNSPRGTFVVFEGGEGSGKSTQAARLAEASGALLTRQPGGSEIGQRIRELLLSPDTVDLDARAEALLMAADRAQHVAQVIRPTLDSGRPVVCDRYLASSLAYQGAGRGLGIDAVLPLSLFAVDDVLPDIVFLLDVPVEVSRARLAGNHDRLEREPDDFHERVRQAFLDLAVGHPERWVTLDGTLPPDDLQDRIAQTLHERFDWKPWTS